MKTLYLVIERSDGSLHNKEIEGADEKIFWENVIKTIGKPSQYRREMSKGKLVSARVINHNDTILTPADKLAEQKEHYRITLLSIGLVNDTFEIIYHLHKHFERNDIIDLIKDCSENKIRKAISEGCDVCKLKFRTEKCLLQYLASLDFDMT